MMIKKWREVELGDICEFSYGKSLPAKERSGSGFPVYGSNGRVGFHHESLTNGETIIIGRKGSFGEVHFSPEPCSPIDTTYYITENQTSAHLPWLARRLRCLGLNRLNRAAAIPGLNRSDAYRQRLLLPSPAEQKRIAEILDAADALRAKRRETITQLDTFLQSTFIEMFGNPVTNPMGWDINPLGCMGSLDRGVSKHRPRNEPSLLGGEYPLIQTGDVSNSGGYIREYSSTYSEIGLKQSKMWSSGTLCITIAASIANTGILTFDACFPDSVVGFKSEKQGRAEYVQGLFWFFREILDRRAPQVAQKNINLKILRELPVPLPPDDLICHFATVVESVEQQKARMRAHLAELDALFASLQHRAFNGEL